MVHIGGVRCTHYARSVTTPAAPNGDGFDVGGGADCALTVPAEELARDGVRPGAHLRLVQEPQLPAPRRSARGALAGSSTPRRSRSSKPHSKTPRPSASLPPSGAGCESRRRLAPSRAPSGQPRTSERARTRSRGHRRCDHFSRVSLSTGGPQKAAMVAGARSARLRARRTPVGPWRRTAQAGQQVDHRVNSTVRERRRRDTHADRQVV